MKVTFAARALAVLAGSTTASAQYNQPDDLITSAPFYLQLSAPDNSSIDGRFLEACHSGAGASTLCVGKLTPPLRRPHIGRFFLNHTGDVNQGIIINERPMINADEGRRQWMLKEPLRLVLSAGTNVGLTWFSPESFNYNLLPQIKFTTAGLSIPISVDDTKFKEGIMPELTGRDADSWYACWVMAIPYYYEALAWVTGPAPQNPTCRPVKVTKVDVEA
ncbi:hypothetical protein B0T14DRAFT_167269 [Immersiella caudata]|uniref:DUF7907 domain-containing protein n=1 Tax=Immersiella caudata TaxID=314043 RepID=A0AA39WXH7_9PEZI|nr:hypothetical protein B0T14DRAFT_167269 [Immersiella caudata]